MTSKTVEVRVLITELHYVSEKTKQKTIDNRPEPMSSLINNPAYFEQQDTWHVYISLILT